MKLLIGTHYIDLSVVTHIEVFEKEDKNLNDSILRLYFFSDNRPVDIRLDLSKLKFYENSDKIIEDIKSKIPAEKLITRAEIETEIAKYCGGFSKYYLVEDVRKLWNEFKEDILYKWDKTESAIKDVIVYK